ncbi:penicillin-binding protein, partial [Streptomyces sp. SID10116]|nr:penicillin-binding protein [Streptomyces sp. SID10116]
AMSEKTAQAVTDALRTTMTDGSAKTAGAAHPAAVGKTGTTTANTAGWFVGGTPDETTAVVVYRMSLKDLVPLSLKGLGGDASATPASRRAVDLWTHYIKALT